jgi:hypothetical protein
MTPTMMPTMMPTEEEIMMPAGTSGLAAVEPEGEFHGGDGDSTRVELEVLPVGDDGWRVSIGGADRGNPFALLGFVTLTGGHYEVCVLGKPGSALAAATLEDALELLRPAPTEVEGILSGIRH